MTPVPTNLSAAFADKSLISAAELCKLLPLDARTLRAHIRHGNISYVQTGLGERSLRRSFTLASIMSFLEGRSRLECPPSTRPAARSVLRRPEPPEDGIKQIHAKLLAERQKAREEMWARNAQAGLDMQDRPRGASGGRVKAKARP